MRLRWLALPILIVACSSSAPEASTAPAPTGVDENDLFCDPIDAIADDETPESAATSPLIRHVSPLLGTGGIAYATGNTYPGPQMPYGMAKPSPDTSLRGQAMSFSHCAGYAYQDDTIEGFSHARLHGAGIADYGNLALMPGTALGTLAPRKHGATFSHANEVASPGYYAVTLDNHIKVELTATSRVAVHRYTFPSAGDEIVYVDAGHAIADKPYNHDGEITVADGGKELAGFAHVMGDYSDRFGGVKLYFVVRFDRAPIESNVHTPKGAQAGAYLKFDRTSAVVNAHVGLSYVDVEHARANLVAESAPFDDVRAATEAAWEKRLSVMKIDARSDRDRKIAYTALYHTAMMPTLASDIDGSYRGLDGAVHRAEGFRYFTDFSLWDTYRNLHSLVTLLYPEDARDFAKSLVRMGQEGGGIPRWPLATGESGGMVGDGGTIVLADTWLRGVRDWDARAAYAIAKNQALVEKRDGQKIGRDGLGDYMSLGYLAKDNRGSSAAITLEYAHADHALGELAAALGETADAELFKGRGKNWKNVYDEGRHFFAGRRRDGSFDEVDPAMMNEDFSEGTPWHYNFMVPHDIAGLAERMGRETFVARAEQLFTRAACNTKLIAFMPNPYYWPSNEPVLFSGWAFGMLGDRDRTARWTRWTALQHYGDGPDGLPGNDDGGTMSAFYLFAVLGIYPIAGTDKWVVGSPLFPKATLALPGGDLTIEAPGASKKRRFPRDITRNGAPVGSTIAHADLANAKLHFVLERTPRD